MFSADFREPGTSEKTAHENTMPAAVSSGGHRAAIYNYGGRLDVTLTSAFDLIRRQRNDLGHPQAIPPAIDRQHAFVFLSFPDDRPGT